MRVVFIIGAIRLHNCEFRSVHGSIDTGGPQKDMAEKKRMCTLSTNAVVLRRPRSRGDVGMNAATRVGMEGDMELGIVVSQWKSRSEFAATP